MNSYFEVSATVCVGGSYPDTIPRPRAAQPQHFLVQPLMGAQFSDFALGWLPVYPNPIRKLRPVYPNWIGVFGPASFSPAAAPIGWAPTYPTYRDAPRLHRAFYRSVFDPASGQFVVVAQRMAWDPKQKAPLITRPRLKETTAFFYVPPPLVITSVVVCTELNDLTLTAPALISEAFSQPTLIDEAETTPALIVEGVC